jgi:hypothetical protein
MIGRAVEEVEAQTALPPLIHIRTAKVAVLAHLCRLEKNRMAAGWAGLTI